MKTTYLCGAITGKSDWECKAWREEAKTRLKTEVLDPLRTDFRGVELFEGNTQTLVNNDIADVAYADFILVNASVPSWGSAMEIVYAYQLKKHIIAFTGGAYPSPWLIYHCTNIFITFEEAVADINGQLSA